MSQPKMNPGCAIGRINSRFGIGASSLINGDRVRECKQKMNTFGFTGALESKPDICCIYQNDAAQNLFQDRSGGPTAPPATGSTQF